jgi:hypothetical protein
MNKIILDELHGSYYNIVIKLNPIRGVNYMANRDIKKEVKKKKKTDTGVMPALKPMMPQPELVKKPKKNV